MDARILRVNLERIGGPQALATPVIAAFVLVGLLFTFVWDIIGAGGDPQIWTLAGMASALVALLFLMVCRMTILPVHERRSRPLLALVVFATAGAIRFLTLQEVITRFTDEPLPSRTFTLSATVAVLIMSLTALAHAREVEHQDALKRLVEERSRLLDMGTGFEERIAEAERELQYQVHEELDPALEEIDRILDQPDSGDQRTIQLLADAVADVVRPMSHHLGAAGRNDPVAVIDGAIHLPPAAWQLRKDIDIRDAIRPGMFCLVFLVATLGYVGPSLLSIPRYLMASALMAGLSTLMLWQLRRLLPEDRPIPGNLAGYAVLLVIYTSIAAVITLMSQASLSFLRLGVTTRTVNSRETFTVGVLVIIVGMCVSFVAVAQRRLLLVEKELEDVNEQLAIAVAMLRGRLWMSRKTLSWILHGPVQSALVSAALELDRPGLQEVDKERIRHRIQEATSYIDSRHTRQPNLAHAIAEMTAVWDITCTIRSDLDPVLLAQLEQDTTAATALIELVREGVSNAVRHGHATEVDIRVRERAGRFARVEVHDNGIGLDGESAPGLGSSILDEVSYRWERTSSGSGTTLRADVPLQS